MDFLLEKAVIIPKDYDLSCYYIVDNQLQYVSLYKDEDFLLSIVDADRTSDIVYTDTKEGRLDYYVLSAVKPIISQTSTYDADKKRVVRISTKRKNVNTLKRKKSTDREIIMRDFSSKKSLF